MGKLGPEKEDELKKGYNQLLLGAQDEMWLMMNRMLFGFSECFSAVAILFLYVLFWLLSPLPTGGKAGALVRSYIYKKTLVSAGYGICVTILFAALGIDLAVLF